MTDLRDQLRQAVSVDERCEALFDLVGASVLTKDVKKRLWDLIDEVEEGKLPTAILTGVVLAMVPDRWTHRIIRVIRGASASLWPDATSSLSFSEASACHPECALALALLDAGAGK